MSHSYSQQTDMETKRYEQYQNIHYQKQVFNLSLQRQFPKRARGSVSQSLD